MNDQWNDKVFGVSQKNFQQVAFEIFDFQYAHNKLYRAYADMLNIRPQKITHLSQIPFLPVQFFKTHTVRTTEFDTGLVFESSGTTQTINSHHYIKDLGLY